MSSHDLAEHYGFSDGVVSRFLAKKGLSLTQEEWQKIRSEKQKKVTTSDSTTDYLLRQLYLLMPVKTMGDLIGRSGTFIDTRLRQLNLVQPRELIDDIIQTFRRKPGDIPVNKGKKQVDYMSAEVIERTKATRFQKGQIPHNAVGFKDGDIVVRDSHKKRGGPRYKWIRTSLGKWKMLHVYNWEKQKGKVPAGYIVVFKNKDTMNCEVDNLEMITLEENMRRNTIHNYPLEIKSAIFKISKLNKKIDYAEKQIKRPERSSVRTA